MMQAVQLDEYREQKSDRSNTFIDFMLDIAGPEGFKIAKGIKEMALKGDARSLQVWFLERGYDIAFEECAKIVECKENLKDFKVNINDLQY